MTYFSSSNPFGAFIEAISREFGASPETIEPDKIVRFDDPSGKPGNKACWAIYFLGAHPAGAYGNWRTGQQAIWRANSGKKMTRSEQQQLKERIDLARQQRYAKVANAHERAAGRAQQIWRGAGIASTNHPYLKKKKILPYTAKQQGNLLILPIVDPLGNLTSLQFISSDGSKKLLSGGKKRGSHIPVNLPNECTRILICEGFATGATLAEAEPTAKVVAAIDAGNLELVAIYMRRNNPESEIVICADADPIGLQKARLAAIKAGADMAVPEFPMGAKGTDFNDLASLVVDV